MRSVPRPCRALATVAAATFATLLLVPPSSADPIPPDTLEDLQARQEALLPACRAALDLDIQFEWSNEFGVYSQVIALLCELEAQERLDPVASPPSPAALQAHWVAMVDRLNYLLDNSAQKVVCPVAPPQCSAATACTSLPHTACCEWLYQPCKNIANPVIARFAAFLLAYVIHEHYPTLLQVPLDPAAGDAFATLARQPVLSAALTATAAPGNSSVPLFGLRILAGEVLFDPHLINRGVSEFYAQLEQVGRRSFNEPNAPHYNGVMVDLLSLLRDAANVGVSADVDQLLAAHFLSPAHPYLPGGGLGAVQDRDKSGGGISDPNPEDAANLVAAINLFVHDPGLPATTGHERFTLASTYEVPELIRSIYLDKGPEPVRYWYRRAAPFVANNGWYEGWFDYASNGWQGLVGKKEWPIRSSPWEAVILPGGNAEMGVAYGEQSYDDASSGLYLRRPGTGDPSFSIVYHRLPRPDEDDPEIEPDPTDGKWDAERSGSARRMLWGDTSVTLWNRDDQWLPALPGTDPNELLVQYTEVHLPDFCDPSVADACDFIQLSTGNTWYLGRSADALVAFLPLGNLAETVDYGDWIYLKLDSPISGNVTVLASTHEFPTLTAFKNHIKNRFVSFTQTPPEVAVDVDDGIGTTRMRLSYEPEVRAITVNPTPSAQEQILYDGTTDPPTDTYFQAELFDSPWATWDESGGRFQLSLQRAEYNDGQPLVFDYGSTTAPTTPLSPRLVCRDGVDPVPNEPICNGTNTGDVTLAWIHSWDDVQIEKYSVYYYDGWLTPSGGTWLGDVTDDGTWAGSLGLKATISGGPVDNTSVSCSRKIYFGIEAWDATPTPSPHRAFVIDVPVRGDIGLPPGAVQHLDVRPANSQVVLSWDPALDDCGVAGYRVSRNGGPPVLVTETTYTDTDVVPGPTYTYSVQAEDEAGHVSTATQPIPASLCTDPDPPSTVTNAAGGEDLYGRSVTLTWDKASDGCAVAEYEVRRDMNPIASVPAEDFQYEDEVRFTDESVAPDQDYLYEIVTVDFDGLSSSAMGVPVSTAADTEAPTAPANVTGTPTPGQIDLTWEASYDYWGVTGYEVVRAPPFASPVQVGVLFYTDTDVTPSVSYDYTIRAIDGANNTSDSATVSVTAD